MSEFDDEGMGDEEGEEEKKKEDRRKRKVSSKKQEELKRRRAEEEERRREREREEEERKQRVELRNDVVRQFYEAAQYMRSKEIPGVKEARISEEKDWAGLRDWATVNRESIGALFVDEDKEFDENFIEQVATDLARGRAGPVTRVVSASMLQSCLIDRYSRAKSMCVLFVYLFQLPRQGLTLSVDQDDVAVMREVAGSVFGNPVQSLFFTLLAAIDVHTLRRVVTSTKILDAAPVAARHKKHEVYRF